ncbi:hypothetical protein B7463_g3849, partial [Scytalidium lignicola]
MSDGNPFDPTQYYRFFNSIVGTNFTLAIGDNSTSPSDPSLTAVLAFPSENWQLFFDSGVYFIRNYDYGSKYQMGVTEGNHSVPVMLPAGGGLGMQWNITKGTEDVGSWVLRNRLLDQVNVFGIDPQAESKNMVVMNTDQKGAQWIIDINVSAGKITDVKMLTTFSSIQSATSTSQSTHSISTSTSTPVANPAQSQLPSDATSHARTISAGAIAGISIGGVIVVLIVLALLYRFYRSRQRKTSANISLHSKPKWQSSTQIQEVPNREVAQRHELYGNKKNTAVAELPAGVHPEVMD